METNDKSKAILLEMMERLNPDFKESLKTMVETVEINESNLNRIFDKYFKNGFIILSSYRGGDEKTPDQNKHDFDELKSIVRNSGFGYIPVYGGFIENKGDSNETEVREPALLIPNQVVGSSKLYDDDSKLYKLSLELIKKYNQDSFLYKPAGSDNKSFYIDKTGNVDMEFKDMSINDLIQQYFTNLSKHDSDKKDDKENDKMSKTAKRFTFTENIYINKSPNSLSESWSRYGEYFYKL